jgi:uncharacterized membrane protein YoaK (UPF0700 family)
MNINLIFVVLSLILFTEMIAYRLRVIHLSGFSFYLWGIMGYVFFTLILIALAWVPSSSVSTILIIVGVLGEGLTRLWETYQEANAATQFPQRWQKWTAMYKQASILQRLLLFPNFKPIDQD